MHYFVSSLPFIYLISKLSEITYVRGEITFCSNSGWHFALPNWNPVQWQQGSSAAALNMGYRGNVEEVRTGWSSRHRRINQMEQSEDSGVKNLFIIIHSVILGVFFFFFGKNNPLRQQKKMASLSLEHH